MSVVDQKFEEDQRRQEFDAGMEEATKLLTESFRAFIDTDDGMKSMEYLSSVMDGHGMGWTPGNGENFNDRVLFSLGMMDVYLMMLAYCIEPGGDLLLGDVYRINPTPESDSRKAVARAFQTREGEYILSQLRKGYYDVAPSEPSEPQRMAGQRWFILHILIIIKAERERKK